MHHYAVSLSAARHRAILSIGWRGFVCPLKVARRRADASGMEDTASAPREARTYDAPISDEDRWLCDYLRRTRPDLLDAMYRADFLPDGAHSR